MKFLYFLLLELVLSLQTNSTSFAFSMYSELILNNQDLNIMYSPYSLRSALSILLEGACKETATELEKFCLLPSNANERHQVMKDSRKAINKQNDKYALQTVNALWPQKSQDFNMLDSFKTVVETYYLAKTEELDYIEDIENSRVTINKWVANETNDKIKDLIPTGVITSDTRLVITNCIYFKGTWKYQFNPDDTANAAFNINSQKSGLVKMMNLNEIKLPYYENQQLQILELPYEGDTLSMIIILSSQELNNFEKQLTSTNFLTWIESLQEQSVNVYLPKFKFEWTEILNEALFNLGIKQMFTDQADLSNINGEKGLTVSRVIQKTFIEVNEQGAEAAGATAIIVNELAIMESKSFIANHPFHFIIYYKPSQEILFLGKVINPENEENNFQMNFYENVVNINQKYEDFATLMNCVQVILLLILFLF